MKNQKGKIDTPTAIVIAGLLIALGIYVSNRGFSLPQKNEQGTPAGIATTPELAPVGPIEVDVENEPTIGDDNAPVTIVEFTEYQCPFCKRYVDETFSQIKENYIDTGKVKYVIRDFPLPFHGNAQKASEAANCADDQGKYWEYHEKLFAEQETWSEKGSDEAIAAFKDYAKNLGLETVEFGKCLDEDAYKDEIDQDLADGQNYGVSGTPSFFINGYLLVGAQPYEAFEQMIEEQL